MKRTLFLLLLATCTLGHACGQVAIYRSYTAFLDQAPEVKEGYRLTALEDLRRNTKLILTPVEGGPPMEVRCKDIWGFRLGSALYRVEPDMGLPAFVVTTDAPWFYENGIAHLRRYLEETTTEYVEWGPPGYLSHDLNSDMKHLGRSNMEYDRLGVGKLLKSTPAYAALRECVGTYFYYHPVRRCILRAAEPPTPEP